MSNIDPNYRTWQTAAAHKIVQQIQDGTLERVAKVGARVGKCSEDEAMASQIVGILLAHLVEDSSLTHDDGEPIQDLYLINTLLSLMVDRQKGWSELEQRYNGTARALHRLRLAFESGEMTQISLDLADYFRETPTKAIEK